MELASRDVISRAEQTEIDEGRGVDGNVLLDLRHLGAEKIIERLHGTRELSMVFAGVDPIHDPIPVRPGAHYHMGGVETDLDGKTALEGLYAAGECACVSVHGANRLGGNALMETITFGKRAGRAAADWALSHTTVTVPEAAEADAKRELDELLDRTDGERPHAIRDEMATTMHENFGVFRREAQMKRQGKIIAGLAERYERVVVDDKSDVFNNDLTQALELGFLLQLAACMIEAGLARKESRGAHARPHDFPDRDDENFLRHTLVSWRDGRPELSMGARAHDEVDAAGAQVLMRRLLLPLALLLALAASACGGVGASPPTASPSSAPAARPSPTPRSKTSDAGSARASVTANVHSERRSRSTMTGKGEFSTSRRPPDAGHDATSSGGAFGDVDRGAGLRRPRLLHEAPARAGLPLPPGKEWFKIDLEAARAKTAGARPRPAHAARPERPDARRSTSSRGRATTSTQSATEDVRGVATTHYTGVDRPATRSPRRTRRSRRRSSSSPSWRPLPTVPIDVWIDDDGFVRRMKQTLEGSGSGPGSSMTMDDRALRLRQRTSTSRSRRLTKSST